LVIRETPGYVVVGSWKKPNSPPSTKWKGKKDAVKNLGNKGKGKVRDDPEGARQVLRKRFSTESQNLGGTKGPSEVMCFQVWTRTQRWKKQEKK